ncbi:MAG: carbon-phosphorus lyase complex subunit PhnI [Opitutales bacterium]|nr:carbon-phosphorus lyase complex subunit PhnI [Opitutales bacterium]
MGYVAIKGGERAIQNAERLVDFYRLRSKTTPVEIEQIRTQFRKALDKIMGEGSLYAPEHAALSLKQTEGDLFEGAFMLRAFRATLNRSYFSEILDTDSMQVERRVSSAFRDLPGGQILGPTRDYVFRLLNTDLVDESLGSISEFVSEQNARKFVADAGSDPTQFPRIVRFLKECGRLRFSPEKKDSRVFDVTREAVKYPAPRSATMQMLARGEQGGMTSMAYSSMRGFGDVEPSVGELRLGKCAVRVRDRRNRLRTIGRIRVAETDLIAKVKEGNRDKVPYMTHGYGLCFGQNELKSLSMAILDRAIRYGDEEQPACQQEFVLYHTEGVESYGFTNHLKLPHYVTFQSGLSNVRQAMKRRDAAQRKAAFGVTGSDASKVKDIPDPQSMYR